MALENGFGVLWYQPTNWSPSASEKGQLVCLCSVRLCACVCAVCTIACTLLLDEAVQHSLLHWKGHCIGPVQDWRHSYCNLVECAVQCGRGKNT